MAPGLGFIRSDPHNKSTEDGQELCDRSLTIPKTSTRRQDYKPHIQAISEAQKAVHRGEGVRGLTSVLLEVQSSPPKDSAKPTQ